MKIEYGKNITIKANAQIGENVILEDGVYIDYNAVIRNNVHIKKNTYIGCNCIIGEYTRDFFEKGMSSNHLTIIGENSIIRSGTIIYADCTIDSCFQTGHRATIRENTVIGQNVRIGTSTDVQFECTIQNNVSVHSNVFIGEKTRIEDYVWIFPGVTITNEPMPPSKILRPVTIKSFASIAARAVLLPGIVVGQNALVGAGAVVTSDVNDEEVVVGNPAKKIKKVSEIKDKVTGERHYPWPLYFDRGMPWEDMGYLEWSIQSKESTEQ